MTLKETIGNDLKGALKNKEELKLSVLRMLASNIKNTEIQKQHALSDEEILDAIGKEIKTRRDSIEQYIKGNRPELAQKENDEIKILDVYLPPQFSEKEIKQIIQTAIGETGAKTISEMGKVMGIVMPKIRSKADPSLVSQLVKNALQ